MRLSKHRRQILKLGIHKILKCGVIPSIWDRHYQLHKSNFTTSHKFNIDKPKSLHTLWWMDKNLASHIDVIPIAHKYVSRVPLNSQWMKPGECERLLIWLHQFQHLHKKRWILHLASCFSQELQPLALSRQWWLVELLEHPSYNVGYGK